MKLLYIDLFCGAGGTSTGVENARYEGRQCAKVIGCVNHDANAIASHAANHLDALHFTEDIRTLELSPLTAHIAEMRRQYPDAFVVLWASLECTNFSKAKGGQPRDADSRTLAEHLFRYIEAINPDYIQIENVEEFMSWGDLDESGKPISKDAGRLYQQWVSNVCGYGYRFAYRILNSADYGAYTTRRRFFGIFAKGSLPIVFPEPTHSKDGATGLFGQMQRWKPVREVLDFTDEGESIFGRKKPLVDATLERIYAGLIKFVAGGKEAFLVKWNSMSQTGKYHAPSIDEPCPTVVTQNRLGIAQVNFLSKHYGGSPAGKCVSVEEPAGTITTWDHHSFITAYYGNGHNHSIDAPAPTLTTRDRLAFVDMQYGNGTPCGIESPAPTVTTNPKHQLVTCRMEQRESAIAGKQFFDTDKDFRPAEFMHFCSQMLRKDKPIKEEKSEGGGRSKGGAACMILFCPFEQMHYYIELGQRYGLKRYIPLVFRKDFSAQVLKANMKVVGNCEYGLILYRDRLPKFNNDGRMIFNCFDWVRDTDTPKIHPTQKPVPLLERLIEIFTDKGDVVIDPCAGSGTTLLAAANMGRKAYGFEIKKDFCAEARVKVLTRISKSLFV